MTTTKQKMTAEEYAKEIHYKGLPSDSLLMQKSAYHFAERYSQHVNKQLTEGIDYKQTVIQTQAKQLNQLKDINTELRKQVKQFESIPNLKELTEKVERLEKEKVILQKLADKRNRIMARWIKKYDLPIAMAILDKQVPEPEKRIKELEEGLANILETAVWFKQYTSIGNGSRLEKSIELVKSLLTQTKKEG